MAAVDGERPNQDVAMAADYRSSDHDLPTWAAPLRPLVDFVAWIRASVHTKLLFGFLIGAFLLLVMAVLSLVVMDRMNERVKDLARLQDNANRVQRMVYLVTAQSHFRVMAFLTQRDSYNSDIPLAKEEFDEHLDIVEATSSQPKTEFFAKVRDDQDRFRDSGASVVAAYEAGDIGLATDLHIDQEHKVSHDLEGAMWELMADTNQGMGEASAAFQADSNFLTNTVWAFSGVSLIVALLLGFVVSWAFVRPVRRIDQAVAAIAGGDFNQKVEVPNRDEFGDLSRNVNSMSEQLGALYAQAEELGAIQERHRLARDLHDSVTQSIFGMTMITEAARVQLERDPTQVMPHLSRLQQLAQGALEDMRSLIRQLRVSPIAEQGLVSTLFQHLASLEQQDGLKVDLRVEGEEILSSEVADGLFRIVQEALNNVSKHANTDRARVTLNMVEGRVTLAIEDEGTGFDPSVEPSEGGGFGLTSMRERAEMLGSRLEVRSTLGKGTHILLEIPVTSGGETDGED